MNSGGGWDWAGVWGQTRAGPADVGLWNGGGDGVSHGELQVRRRLSRR